jgi:hypothetical protein
MAYFRACFVERLRLAILTETLLCRRLHGAALSFARSGAIDWWPDRQTGARRSEIPLKRLTFDPVKLPGACGS